MVAAIQFSLLLAEGHAVSTLINSGVCFVSTHHDPLQRAVVGIAAMMSTLGNSTLNALICMAIHSLFLLFSVILKVYPQSRNQSVFFD